MKFACRQHEIVIHTYPKNPEYLVTSGAQNKGEEFDTKDEETVALPVDEERSKLADSFYRLEHQEEDLINKKVESLLLRL
ncbi:putative saf4/Yju2 protein [Helianthus annuus]|nr:putative saf4/Yju2 protein [Helianthus annuus]